MHGKSFGRFLSLTLYLLFALPLVPAGADQDAALVLSSLRGNPKLVAADEVLADFDRGAPETAVIVSLRPSKEAQALEDLSRSSAKVPPEFTRPGAAPYYNLQDDSIRRQLQATVAATVDRVLARLEPEGITVTRKYTYIFGFAAKVTPEALARIVAVPEVVCVEKDQILKLHPAPVTSPSGQSLP